jgi:hypothetical protein
MPSLKMIMEGIDILSKHNPDILNDYPESDHDVIYICDLDGFDDLTENETNKLNDLRFYKDEENNSWIIFT